MVKPIEAGHWEDATQRARLFTNPTATPKTISLDTTYRNVEGQLVSGSLTLAPFTSQILVLNGVGCADSPTDMNSTPSANILPTSPPLQPLPPTMNLTINFSGTGQGRVTTDPRGIDCESSQVKCSNSYETAEWIKLIPVAAANSQFTGWNGYQSDCDDGEVFMNGYRSCNASFNLLRFPLKINLVGQGQVSSDPTGIRCGDQCRYVFNIDTNVTLTATPKNGWQFQGWSGDCDPSGSVVINKDKACQAIFVFQINAGSDKVVSLDEETIFTTAFIDNGLHYQWDFGDGNTANTAITSHTYTTTGTYTATLTVTDEKERIGSDTLTVEVIKDAGIEIPQDVLNEIKNQGYAKIILSLNLATQPEGELSLAAILDQRSQIAQLQQQFINSLSTSLINSPTGNQNLAFPTLFTTIPYVAMGVNAIQLAHISKNPLITHIELDKLLIGGFNVPANRYLGANQTIAILDTGVDNIYPDLAGPVILEACYSTTDAPYSATTLCPSGNDKQLGTDAAIPCAIPGCEHGTQVAEKVVANEVDLIAIQVFSRLDDANYCAPYPSPCIKSFSADQIQALEQLLTLYSSGYPLAAIIINLDGKDASDYCESPARQAIIDNLHSVGITTLITSGNDDYSNSGSVSTCISPAPNFDATKPSSDTEGPEGLTEPPVTDSQAILAAMAFSLLPPETQPCYASGLVDWVCNAQGQTLTDLTVGPNGMISSGTLVGTLTNQGRVSNLTLEPYSRLTGGIVTGYIINHGEMANFEFRGAEIVGGVLAGQIFNTSQVGGYFRDVQLAAGTHLIGGQLVGEISGDVQAPALLEYLVIPANSYLEYVTIGDGVKLATTVTFGEGVQFNHPSDDPRLGYK